MPKRNLTVGVTVNLQNYESLRVEVQDEVEGDEDVQALVAFLDETLALFGRQDTATRQAVDHYRTRVMRGVAGGAPAGRAGAVSVVEPVVEPPAPVPVATEPPEEARAPKPATKAAAKSAGTTPAKVPAPSSTGAVCEVCGQPVSAAEEKTSRLFVSRTLCKKCIQSL